MSTFYRNVNGGHFDAATHGFVERCTPMYFTAAFMLASALNTDRPALPSSVDFHVPFKYWKTPDADELLFFALGLNPDLFHL